MKKYRIGQKVKFNNGLEGEVISIGAIGNGDIRPPYHKEGLPTIKGVTFIGYITIIPDEWEKLYGDEINEKEILLDSEL